MAGMVAPPCSQPARHNLAAHNWGCSRRLLAAPGPRHRFRARVQAAAAAPAPGQPEPPATGPPPPSLSPPPQPLAAAAEGHSNSNGHLHLPNSLFVAFPKLPPEGSTLTAEEERCDPYSERCKTPIHVWESRCTACSATGTQRNSGSSSGSSSRGGRGGGRHTRLGVCLLCSGLGYVRHTTNRPESVPYVNGTGPHTTIGRPPPPEQKPRRFQFPGGGKK